MLDINPKLIPSLGPSLKFNPNPFKKGQSWADPGPILGLDPSLIDTFWCGMLAHRKSISLFHHHDRWNCILLLQRYFLLSIIFLPSSTSLFLFVTWQILFMYRNDLHIVSYIIIITLSLMTVTVFLPLRSAGLINEFILTCGYYSWRPKKETTFTKNIFSNKYLFQSL